MLSNIQAGFASAFEQAEQWREKALAIRVTSLADKEAMKEAREMRLALKNIRVDAEKKRKALKEEALIMGRAIDGVNNLLLAAIKPLETHLEEQEKFAERLAEQERQRRLTERIEAIQPYLESGQLVPALDVMTDEQFAKYLEDAKLLYAAKIEAAKKAEAERIAREQAEAAERERLRIENERLKAEAEAAAKAAREAAEKAQAERIAMEAKANAERIAAERAQREAAENARKEREALEAKAKAEREAAERELARMKAEQEAAAKAEREAREKLERELAAKKAQEEAKAKAEAAAAKKAAAAPDKTKLRAIADSVRNIALPTVTTPEASAVLADIAAKRESFAKWIEAQISNL